MSAATEATDVHKPAACSVTFTIVKMITGLSAFVERGVLVCVGGCCPRHVAGGFNGVCFREGKRGRVNLRA